MLTRRKLLAGSLAAAALAVAGFFYERRTFLLREDDREIVAAIAPVMLGVSVPIDAVIRGVDVAIDGLPLAVQAEIQQLFALLRFPFTRVAAAGIWSPWDAASGEQIAQFLTRWRYSRFAKLRSAYDALHQLIMAAWYGNEKSWRAIDYPGPPPLVL